MPFKPREIEGMLVTKLGMVQFEADHTWFELHLEGLPTIKTKLPHHKKDIADGLESRVYKQLRIRKSFFNELMTCTKYLKDYDAVLRCDPYPPFTQLIV